MILNFSSIAGQGSILIDPKPDAGSGAFSGNAKQGAFSILSVSDQY